MIVLIENQSTPDRRMPARAMTRTGLLYETLGALARGPDGRFPPMLLVVVYTGHRPWRPPDDLSGLVRMPAGHSLPWLTGRCYARLDLRDLATQYPERANRMAALARLTFTESAFGADTGQRLGTKLENVNDPSLLDRVGDLIVNCESGEQFLESIDRADAHSS